MLENLQEKIKYIGWCNKNSHDKVWAIIELPNNKHVTVWGKRGKALQYKIFDCEFYYRNLAVINEKVRKKSNQYTKISFDDVDSVYPTFKDDLNMMAFLATLSA